MPTTQVCLWVLHSLFDLPATPSNVAAVAVGAVPAYLASRAWVWQVRDRHSVHSVAGQALPFWAYNFVGLVLSSVAVAWAERRYGATGSIDWPVHIANVVSFGVLWVGKFVLADQVLFKLHRPVTPRGRTGAG